METILANGISWLSRQVPALAFMMFVMVSTVWVTLMINNFDHRLAETERLCNDINTRQLPEIRTEMDKRFSEVDKRFSEIDTRLLEVDKKLLKIEMQLTTIITYIETKEGRKPKFP